MTGSIIASIAAKWLRLTKVPVALPNDWSLRR